MQQNSFYILRSSDEVTLSSYSHNPDTGESEIVTNTYGYPYGFYIGANNRPKNVNYKPVFVIPSNIIYNNYTIIMYDKDNNRIGYKIDQYRYTQRKQKIELDPNTYAIDVNVNVTDNPKFAKIWFYVGYEVIPHYKKLELQNKKENGQMFFRESLNGTITLFGDDYNYVRTARLEQNLMLAIFNGNTLIAKNLFNKTDCKFDYAKYSAELKLSPEDRYTDILNKYDNTYDIIKLAPKISRLILTKRMAYQIYIAGANNITTVANGTYWEDDVDEPIYDLQELERRYFANTGSNYYEIHLDGFNYRNINAVYIIDGNSDTWNANPTPTASIKFVKRYSRGQQIPFSSALKLSNESAITVISSGDQSGGISNYDIYKIVVYTGPNGTGSAIYESRSYYVKDADNFLISPDHTYRMERINQTVPMINPTPETFDLGDNIIEYSVCCRVVCDVDEVEINGVIHTTYDLPAEDFVYNRANYKKCIGLVGLNLYQVKALSNTPTKYGMDDYRNYFTSNFLGTGSLFYGRPIPVSRSSWANTSIWVTFNSNWATNFESKFRKEYTLKDAYDLADVISAMLAKIDPAIKHEGTTEYSQFLYSEISPLSFDTARNGYRVYIAPKSNVLKGNYDQAAQKAELTFEQLMNMLKNCFRCYWFIDEYNRFRIEHISYFLNGMSYENPTVQFDLTDKYDKFNKKKALYCQQEIEFEKDDLSSRFEFSWMDDCTDLFGNNAIDVKSKYIQQDKVEDINSDVFSSDVDLMLYAPDKFSSDGFALLIARNLDGKVPIGSDTQFMDSEYIYPYDAVPQNFLASWLYLMRYYMYDMPATNISYDGVPPINAMRVAGIKKCMKHEIEFPANQLSVDINRLITTEIGNGYIEEMSTNIDTGMTKVELRYEPR